MESGTANNSPIQVTPYVVEAYQRRTDAGINHRVAIMSTGLAMWESNPLFGIGLGSFLWSEKQKGNFAAIHMTAGWWLVEMGVVGLLVFSEFFIWIIRRLWRLQKVPIKRPIALAAWTMMFVLIGASLGMEVMYQRYLWFILGWAISTSKFGEKAETYD
jgi:O-antigen ligase